MKTVNSSNRSGQIALKGRDEGIKRNQRFLRAGKSRRRRKKRGTRKVPRQ
jgi:hypothetical protein